MHASHALPALAIVPTVPSKTRPGDVGEFTREARAWLAYLPGGPHATVTFDNSLGLVRRRAEVERKLLALRPQKFGAVGFFMHGLDRQMQTGHQLGHVDRLASLLHELLTPAPVIALYACDAGNAPKRTAGPGGNNGFADKLRDALLKRDHAWFWGGHVDAHVTTGHTTRNPHVRRFSSFVLPHEAVLGDSVGGDYLVEPGSALWRRWTDALWSRREPKDIRLRFPFLTAAEIEQELQ